MSIAKKETKKLFYQIGEVAKELDVNVSLIRFWEKDFDNLKTIYFLVKERGYTLDGAKRKIKDNKEEKNDNLSIIRHLKEIRKFLVELKEQL